LGRNRDELVRQARRMGLCPCKRLARQIARFRPNPKGRCLFGLIVGVAALAKAKALAARRALHPIAKRHLRGPEKIMNRL
jgi:hypothetical protein